MVMVVVVMVIGDSGGGFSAASDGDVESKPKMNK